ncbi:hypothetical protein Cadr_000001365 [Camelus dromedarius]|uniref:Uncharacterized protein n=1 Tax=Camelus dromedarius TaxID=9838 RepID=A0A5N4EHJ0_CAMDR|nr:hypothetical protein Cadr_000001365 [Camelus dromedarius]
MTQWWLNQTQCCPQGLKALGEGIARRRQAKGFRRHARIVARVVWVRTKERRIGKIRSRFTFSLERDNRLVRVLPAPRTPWPRVGPPRAIVWGASPWLCAVLGFPSPAKSRGFCFPGPPRASSRCPQVRSTRTGNSSPVARSWDCLPGGLHPRPGLSWADVLARPEPGVGWGGRLSSQARWTISRGTEEPRAKGGVECWERPEYQTWRWPVDIRGRSNSRRRWAGSRCPRSRLSGRRPGRCPPRPRTETSPPALCCGALAPHSLHLLPSLPAPTPGRAARGGAVSARLAAEVGGGSQRHQPPRRSDRREDAALSCSPARAGCPAPAAEPKALVPSPSRRLGNHQSDPRAAHIWLPRLSRNARAGSVSVIHLLGTRQSPKEAFGSLEEGMGEVLGPGTSSGNKIVTDLWEPAIDGQLRHAWREMEGEEYSGFWLLPPSCILITCQCLPLAKPSQHPNDLGA